MSFQLIFTVVFCAIILYIDLKLTVFNNYYCIDTINMSKIVYSGRIIPENWRCAIRLVEDDGKKCFGITKVVKMSCEAPSGFNDEIYLRKDCYYMFQDGKIRCSKENTNFFLDE